MRCSRKYLHVFTVNDDPHKRLWKYGRLHIRAFWMMFEWQWCCGSTNNTQAYFIVGGEDRSFGYLLSIKHVLFTTFSIRILPQRWHWKVWPNKRETGIRILGGYKTLGEIKVWHRPRNGWKRGERIWTKWNIVPYGKMFDRVFGRVEVHKTPIKEVQTTIPLPEGTYPARVTLEEWQWKRPRAFWSTRRFKSEVEPETAPPVPGKGTTSYNCDDDCIYSQSGPDKTVHAAVASFVASVLRDRERYGGSIDWQPQKAKV